MDTPEPPPPAVAKKLFKNLKTRESYEGVYEEEFWEDFIRYDLPATVEHWVNKEKLKKEAEDADYKSEKLDMVMEWLEKGVSLGCNKATARMPTERPNMASSYEWGEMMTDTIQSWCAMGIAAGPYSREELEARGWKIKINPMQVRVKPNGKLRIILDLSAPHLQEWEEKLGLPNSVNSGINKEDFRCPMADTKRVLETLHRIGKDAQFTKVDWASAYKHLGVRVEDWPLQCVEWGGKIFIELRMTFGCTSSPTRFHVLSDVIKEISAKNVGMDKDDIPKCLDDAIPIQTQKSGLVPKVEKEYRRLCESIEVRLAEPEYAGKTFSASRKGEVLGLIYDLDNWCWWIPEAKMLRLVKELKEIVTSEEVDVKLTEKVMGKITHYQQLIPYGKYNRSWLLSLVREGKWDGSKVKIDDVSRHQAQWWIAALMTSKNGTRIPDPRDFRAEACINIYTDAAGGGQFGESKGGMGGVTWNIPTPKSMAWMIMMWPEWLISGGKSSLGVKFSSKLTTLEGLGCLTQLAVSHRELRGKAVRLWCDNSGFVHAMRSGSSTCLYVATISKALMEVARGLDIRFEVVKTGRMSGPGERAADALSKGDMDRAWEDIGKVREEESRQVPKVIREWIQDPVPDPELGLRILDELDGQQKVLQWETRRLTMKQLRESAQIIMSEQRRAAKIKARAEAIQKKQAQKRKREMSK